MPESTSPRWRHSLRRKPSAERALRDRGQIRAPITRTLVSNRCFAHLTVQPGAGARGDSSGWVMTSPGTTGSSPAPGPPSRRAWIVSGQAGRLFPCYSDRGLGAAPPLRCSDGSGRTQESVQGLELNWPQLLQAELRQIAGLVAVFNVASTGSRRGLETCLAPQGNNSAVLAEENT